ncbi:MAG: nucleotidyltransferase domain-containing protein, partial [Proteobacteria bacterium]|nr:nucleotidyltransferase domain-containing protein [Pseudomonadota bacterium]
MSSKLAEILFKDYRRRVLALLLLNPDKRYHVREIARLTGTVAG